MTRKEAPAAAEPVVLTKDSARPLRPGELITAATIAVLSVASGTAGAVIEDNPRIDWLYLAWAVFGLVSLGLAAWAAQKRREYVSQLLAVGLSAPAAAVGEVVQTLAAAGATRETTMLLSRRAPGR